MNIVIVGGGTAGWLSAFILSKQRPEHTYTVVDSSKIGIIGVGESTTGMFRQYIMDPSYGTSEEEFMEETDATLKMGIYFKDWKDLGEEFYNPLQPSVTYTNECDVLTYYYHYLGDYPDKSSITGYLTRKGLSTYYNPERTSGMGKSNNYHTYHFDTHKTAAFLKKVSLSRNDDVTLNTTVNHIDAKVEDCILDENGFITSIILDDGRKIGGDFFIDASGFSRVLINKVENSWISFRKNLPMNSAIPFVIDHEDTIESVTKCTALSSGWLWQIPTRKKIGCGYVYCDEYISDEDAKKEVEEFLGKEINSEKIIKFDSGRFEKVWSKNCLAVGIAGSFLEPLQSTNIHTTIVQIENFVDKYMKSSFEDTYSEACSNKYNAEIGMMVDNFRDFVNMHYSGNRTDTPFWKMISKKEHLTEFSRSIIELSRHKGVLYDDFLYFRGCTGIQLWIYSLIGLGHVPKEALDRIFSNVSWLQRGKMDLETHINIMEKDCEVYLTNQELYSLLN